jgi:hypothetical protein
MRTTLDIEDDILAAAKELARSERATTGKIISDLARRSLTAPPAGKKAVLRGGVPVLPSRGEIITSEKIREIMDREGV